MSVLSKSSSKAASPAPGAGAAPVPGQSRYGWLAAALRARVLQGEWVPGEAIPPESVLATSYGVALGTIRQALALLVSDGLLERRHGKGTFVKPGLDGASMMRFFRFRQSGEVQAPQSRILNRKIRIADIDEADALGLPAGASVLVLERLRSIDAQPRLLETLVLPLPAFDALARSDTSAWDDLLYPMFQRVCGVVIHRAEDQLSFGQFTQQQAKRLNLEKGHPCVRVQRRAFDLADRCVELRTTLGDAFSFEYTAQVR
jgi:GntR family transcriptional regulator